MAQGYYYDSATTTWIAIGVGPQGPQGQMGAVGPQGNQGTQGNQGFQGSQGPQGSPASVVYDSGTIGNQSANLANTGIAALTTAGMYLLSGSCWETGIATSGTPVVPAMGFFSTPAGTKSQTLYGSTASGNVLGTQTSFAAVLYHDGTASGMGFQSTGYASGSGTTMKYSYRITIQYMKA